MAEDIKAIITELDGLRMRADAVLEELLKIAASDVAAKHPGCVVIACSAMGSWHATAYDVSCIYDDGSESKRDVHYSANKGDEPHDAFEVFDLVWDQLQTYPTLRITIDADGKQTIDNDW